MVDNFNIIVYKIFNYTPTHREEAILQSPCPSVRLSVRSHFRNRYLSFYWKKWLHIFFLFTVRLTNEWVGVFLARRSVQHRIIIISDLSIRSGTRYFYPYKVVQSNLPMRSPLLSSHMYWKVTFYLSCHKTFYMNWTSFKRAPVLKDHPLFVPKVTS
jgi:hypothetical protein